MDITVKSLISYAQLKIQSKIYIFEAYSIYSKNITKDLQEEMEVYCCLKQTNKQKKTKQNCKSLTISRTIKTIKRKKKKRMDLVKLRVKFTVYRNKGFQQSDRIETID